MSPRPSGLHHSASTNYATACPIIITARFKFIIITFTQKVQRFLKENYKIFYVTRKLQNIQGVLQLGHRKYFDVTENLIYY
jgi:hypothetical protein